MTFSLLENIAVDR